MNAKSIRYLGVEKPDGTRDMICLDMLEGIRKHGDGPTVRSLIGCKIMEVFSDIGKADEWVAEKSKD